MFKVWLWNNGTCFIRSLLFKCFKPKKKLQSNKLLMFSLLMVTYKTDEALMLLQSCSKPATYLLLELWKFTLPAVISYQLPKKWSESAQQDHNIGVVIALPQKKIVYPDVNCLMCYSEKSLSTRWGRDKMAAIFPTTLLDAFSWMKMLSFWLEFHLILVLRVQLTISQDWFR